MGYGAATFVPSMSQTKIRYLPALDGLRALAVAGVICYHGGLAWAGGGFLGVDAFFVLSGYLITTLLLREWGSSATGTEWNAVGRIDLKADRSRETLVVQAAHGEPGVDVPAVAAALRVELRVMAAWLELEHVEVRRKGDLSAPLAAML